ncbi:hypothetical protein BTA51_20215 [Hahella sp. CCB-MM4]|uniref:S8 family serine peptidase n=1 Tax=Hahella sp. (strain CCB-MM4) TaxID=1926491 RepID=UPI000B9B71C3|nr:S8 family serine peptidase [Hahella sp. CCB-MM4]OZG71606.1 hypothetical protein BTA51_20215 [Hahella sp. CCB-MM4]
MPHGFQRLLLIVTTTVTLVACGGGGGGGSSDGSDDSFSVSGRVTIPEFVYVDADTSDTGGTDISPENNSSSVAQRVPNPSIIGGYVSSSSGIYSTGYPYFVDTTDVYLTTLIAGQEVMISAYDADTGLTSITASLYRQADPDIAVDTGVIADNSSVTLTAPDSGNFYIEVINSAGPSTYILNVAGDADIATLAASEDSAEFVPGEAIIQYVPGISATSVADVPLPGYFIERMNDEGTHGLFRFSFTESSGTRQSAGLSSSELREKTLEMIKSLKSRPDILLAEPNYIRKSLEVTPVDPDYHLQWNYPQIGLPAAWEDSNGIGVVIAVIDTGVLLDHPDLSNQLLRNGMSVVGYDFVSSSSSSSDGDGIDSDPSDPGGGSFHGTHVAGIVAAESNSIGGIGVAYKSRIMPIRVLGSNGSGSDADLIQGIRYAAQLSNSSGTLPSKKADVINMSLGGPGYSSSLGQAVIDAIDAGVIVVAAAGNDKTNIPYYPAAYNGVISVSATDLNNQKAHYSNFGSTIDVAAPGGDEFSQIYSTTGDNYNGTVLNSYGFKIGTSMATPHIAGVMALMKQIKNENFESFNSADANSLLQSGDITVDLGEVGRDDIYGYGLISAPKAIQAAGAITFPTISASDSSIVFTNSGTETLILTIPDGVVLDGFNFESEGTASWLTVAESGPMDGTAYNVVVDETGLDLGGSYSGEIVFNYTSTKDPGTGPIVENKTLTIPITLVLVDPSNSPDAGRHYILLTDEDSVVTIQGTPAKDYYQATAVANNGKYTFTITNVPAGKYILNAGSDNDNDGTICDKGEACGFYPFTSQPEVIEITGNRSGLTFATGYSGAVSTSSTAVQVPLEGFPHH